MKESYGEGLANHTGLRSYAGTCESVGGTLIEGSAGWVLSREMTRESGCRRRGVERKATSTAATAYGAEEPGEV
jgi:hypothetical protein